MAFFAMIDRKINKEKRSKGRLLLAVRDGSEGGGATSTKQPFAAAAAIRQEIAPTCDVMEKGRLGGVGLWGGGVDGEHEKAKQKSKGVFF